MTHAVPARLALTLLFAALVVGGSAAPARAHALLTGSEPASGARLESAPGAVRLTLTEQPDPAASSIKVLDASGASVEQGPAKAEGLTYTVALNDLPDGVYTVTWRVLSRVDGHVTGGAFAFGVRADPGSVTLTQADVGPKPSVAGVAGRALLYAGGFLVIGAAVAGWAFGRAPARTRPMARAGWFVAVTGVVLIAVGQAGDAGIGLGALLSSSIGTSLLWRLGPLIVGGVALLVLRGSVVAAGAAAAAFGAHVFYGHAGAGSDRLFKIGAQWLHLTAAAVWIGGLVVLLAGMNLVDPETRGRAAKRYSSLALVMFVVVGALGSVRALDEVGSWGALTSTTFGKIVLFKVAMLGVLLILGAVNRFKTVGRAADDPRPLLRVGRVEVVVATLILMATGVLASVAPAKDAEAVGRAELTVEGTDFGETVRASLRVSPGRPGPNEFEVALTEPGSGDPVLADEVRLRFIYAGVPSVEPTELALRRAGDGVYRANGSNLAVPGPWTVVVGTRSGIDTAEIRLTVGTRTVQQVTPIEQAGAPTIYDIGVGDGRVQMYLSPGEPGQNEVHATFYDAAGQEDPASDVVLVATPPSGDPRRLRIRMLTPGHLVADAQLTAGLWRFDVFGTTGSAGTKTAWFEQRVGT